MFFDPPTEPEGPREPAGFDPCGYFPMRLEPGYLTKIEQGQAVVGQLPDENWSDELIPHLEFLSPLELNVLQQLSENPESVRSSVDPSTIQKSPHPSQVRREELNQRSIYCLHMLGKVRRFAASRYGSRHPIVFGDSKPLPASTEYP